MKFYHLRSLWTRCCSYHGVITDPLSSTQSVGKIYCSRVFYRSCNSCCQSLPSLWTSSKHCLSRSPFVANPIGALYSLKASVVGVPSLYRASFTMYLRYFVPSRWSLSSVSSWRVLVRRAKRYALDSAAGFLARTEFKFGILCSRGVRW